ncbi:F-box/kelch-repeat protein At5g42350-like [Aristolochia californica]|uniref:F-box/kelch-repeat protein At5g42350-like n=1 Tax=Aristolochia californica TaxID=171875 RepID=UPI0035D8C64F
MSVSTLKRSGSTGKRALLRTDSPTAMEIGITRERVTGESSSVPRDFKALSVSKKLARSVSQKFKKKNKTVDNEEEDGSHRSLSSSGCLCFYGSGGGCKVGADTMQDLVDGNDNRRKSSAGEESMAYRAISVLGIEEARVDCFSHNMAGRLWRRSSRKGKGAELAHTSDLSPCFLPDDVLEMCLARLPFTSLMNARLVCRKWRALTTSAHFMETRARGCYQSPCLFVFGAVKAGFCSGQIHAFDVCFGHWHRIRADMLQGRFSFSVSSVGNDIYVVGGCSSLRNFGRLDKSSSKTHKSVMVYSPITGSWRKVAPMKSARSVPILGVFEVSSSSIFFQNRQNWQDVRLSRSRIRGVSDVYEDPHRFSLRRQLREPSTENEFPVESFRKSFKLVEQETDHLDRKDCKRFILITVGGQGLWDEPLDTGEIYDPLSNKWLEITRLPGDLGVVSSGVVCKGRFYVYSEMSKLAAYDIEQGHWVLIQTAHLPPRLHEYHPKLVSCSDRLFLLCVSWCERDGQFNRREKAVRKLWELDLAQHTWAEVSRHPDAPMDWNAAFVADKGKVYGMEMFKVFGQVLDFLTVCDISKPSEMKWAWISRKHLAHELDASSCMTKSMVVLHL